MGMNKNLSSNNNKKYEYRYLMKLIPSSLDIK